MTAVKTVPILGGTPDQAAHQEYRTIPLQEIRESKTNPRRKFNESALADLTESIRQMGVLEPLLVRASQGKPSHCFEIVSGARRYRATKAAGFTDVPCRILALTDQQVLEIQVVENLQRDDLHPLEEAKGYEALMAPPHRMTAATVAGKIGMSERYVYDRVKLLQLTQPLHDAFWDGSITAGHAVLLARIPGDQQALCLDTALFEAERTLFDPHDHGDQDRSAPRKAISVRELQAWIDEHVRFDHKAPDPMLYPETAKTLEQAAERDQKVLPISYEHVVEDSAKSNVKIFGPRSWVRADGQHGTKTCNFTELGLVVAGPRRGETFNICREKKTCLLHYGREIRERAKREQEAATPGSHAKGSQADRSEARRKAEEDEREAARQRWKWAGPAIIKAVADRINQCLRVDASFLFDLVVEKITRASYPVDQQTDSLVLRGTTAEEILRHLAFLLLREEAENEYQGPRDFPKRAKALGIDLAKILKPAATVSAPTTPPKKRK